MNSICVYLHINKLTQEVFYVGVGNIKRPYVFHNRNKDWHKYTSTNDFYVKIIYYKLSWKKAFKIEKKLIKKYGRLDKGLGTLLNKSYGGEGMQGIGVWSTDKLLKEASKYKTRSEFYKKSCGAYKAATRNGILDQVCQHMKSNRKVNKFKLTKENCINIAKQFNIKIDLMNSNKSIYNKIIRERWQNDCFSHMKKVVDKGYCISVALNFKNTEELKLKNKYIYNVIYKNKWQDECFAHINKKYVRTIEFSKNCDLCKTKNTLYIEV